MFNQTLVSGNFSADNYALAVGVHWLKALRSHEVDLAFKAELYGTVIISPMGFILNITSLIIFCQINTHRSAPGLHLIFIAIADNLSLVGIFLMESSAFDIYSGIPNIHILHIIMCRAIPVFANGAWLWCGLLLASATVERYLCVAFPLKVKTWNMLKISKVLIGVFFVISFGLNVPAMVEYSIVEINCEKTCIVMVGEGVVYVIDLILNSILSNLVVLGIILAFAIAISFRLYKFKTQRHDLSQNMSNHSNREFMITAMLFTVSCTFLVTRIPIVLIHEIGKYLQVNGKLNAQIARHLLIGYAIGSLLQVICHSSNFLIYIVFFKEFRDKCFYMCKSSRGPSKNVGKTKERSPIAFISQHANQQLAIARWQI